MTNTDTSTTSEPAHVRRETTLKIIALATALLLENGQSTEETVAAADRLGRALGEPVTLRAYWGEIHVHSTSLHETVPAMPLGVDMVKVMATMKIIDHVCHGTLPDAALSALAAVKHLRPASTLRFVLFAAIAAASLGVIWGALDLASLLLIAFSAGLGAVLRRRLATLGGNPFVQPLCAGAVTGIIGAINTRFQLANAQLLIALCPCMILVPGPHILNGAIDLARARMALGVARLTYSGVIVLAISMGLLAGLAAGGATLPADTSSVPVSLGADVIAAGCAAAGYATFFSIPLRLLPLPMVVGMLGHAARWALVSLAGAGSATGALVACILVGTIGTPVADRLRLPFGALGFSAVVSMMPGFLLFRVASGLVELVSIGKDASADLLPNIVANGTTSFLIILAMTFGLILPRMLLKRFLTSSLPEQPQHA